MFGERCELRKGLAVLDTQKRQLSCRSGAKLAIYIHCLESLVAGQE